MYQCPHVQERFEIIVDFFANTVRCKDLSLPDTEDVLKDVSKMNTLQRRLQQMAYKFDSYMRKFDSRLADTDSRITSFEINLTEQLNHASSRFASSATRHYNLLTKYASETFTTFQNNLTANTEQFLDTQRSKIRDMHTANKVKIELNVKEAEDAFNARLEQALERAIQEILSTADEATDNINAQVEHLLQGAQRDHWRSGVPKPSKMFPNVDVSQFKSEAKSSGDHENHLTTDMYHDDSDDDDTDGEPSFPTIGQFTNSNSNSSENLTSLPPVNHHGMLKRVQLPYPCREQSYIWYLQLKSNAAQYGVYLIGTAEFKKDKSLCPVIVHGFKITLARYHDVKGTLYHFLAQCAIISTDHTDLRNIINRHAVSTDGYHVLYEVMQRIHPALDPDVIFTAHMSNDYADIHEYYTYLTSFIMHEGFAGRHYNPREQVNHFLRGLDNSYYPAIKRVHSQMDSWKTSDPEVLENLILANLPNNIEKYMEEDGKQAYLVPAYV